MQNCCNIIMLMGKPMAAEALEPGERPIVLALCSCRRCALCYLIFVVFFVFIFWVRVLAVVVDFGFDMAFALFNELIFPGFEFAGGARVFFGRCGCGWRFWRAG